MQFGLWDGRDDDRSRQTTCTGAAVGQPGGRVLSRHNDFQPHRQAGGGVVFLLNNLLRDIQ